MPKFKDIIQSRAFVIGGSIFLLFLLVVSFGQFRNRHSIQKEIDALTKQADQIQKNNEEVKNFIAYLKTDSYKEQAARQQLNLKKEGEVVYSFSALSPQTEVVNQEEAIRQENANQSNFNKWVTYFLRGGNP
ncbi:MAG: septum formation initiator family protein [Patescibacteria group bacterium]